LTGSSVSMRRAERLIAAWNERQAKRMPMLFPQRSQGNLRFDCGGHGKF
jgi:hypothetical protein